MMRRVGLLPLLVGVALAVLVASVYAAMAATWNDAASTAGSINAASDTDGDGEWDPADPDSDNDGVCDTGGPFPDGTPGTPPGGCTTGPEGYDNCVSTPNPLQENADFDLNAGGATVGGVALPSDADGDACDDDDDNDAFDGASMQTQDPGSEATTCSAGAFPLWADCIETYLGTVIDDNCTGSPGPGGDAWPPDMNVDSDVNMLDVFEMFPFWLGPGIRQDLNADGDVNMLDVFLMFPFWLKSCT